MAAAGALWLVAQFPAPLDVALRATVHGARHARIDLRAGPFCDRQYGQIGGSLTKWPPR